MTLQTCIYTAQSFVLKQEYLVHSIVTALYATLCWRFVRFLSIACNVFALHITQKGLLLVIKLSGCLSSFCECVPTETLMTHFGATCSHAVDPKNQVLHDITRLTVHVHMYTRYCITTNFVIFFICHYITSKSGTHLQLVSLKL